MGSGAQQELGSSTNPPTALHGAALGSTCTALAKRVISSPRCPCFSCLFIASRVPASLDQDKAEPSAPVSSHSHSPALSQCFSPRAPAQSHHIPCIQPWILRAPGSIWAHREGRRKIHPRESQPCWSHWRGTMIIMGLQCQHMALLCPTLQKAAHPKARQVRLPSPSIPL